MGEKSFVFALDEFGCCFESKPKKKTSFFLNEFLKYGVCPIPIKSFFWAEFRRHRRKELSAAIVYVLCGCFSFGRYQAISFIRLNIS